MSTILHIRKNVLKLTQHGLAQLCGTNQATVSRWEKGELFPDLSQMSAIRAEVRRKRLKWDDRWFFEAPAIKAPADGAAA